MATSISSVAAVKRKYMDLWNC